MVSRQSHNRHSVAETNDRYSPHVSTGVWMTTATMKTTRPLVVASALLFALTLAGCSHDGPSTAGRSAAGGSATAGSNGGGQPANSAESDADASDEPSTGTEDH